MLTDPQRNGGRDRDDGHLLFGGHRHGLCVPVIWQVALGKLVTCSQTEFAGKRGTTVPWRPCSQSPS
jgi:hypothetical protein